MTSFGPQVAQSVAGVNQAERLVARDVDRKRTEPRKSTQSRGTDRVDLEVEGVEHLGAVRALKGNEQEESGADRQKSARYGPGAKPAAPCEPNIDLNA